MIQITPTSGLATNRELRRLHPVSRRYTQNINMQRTPFTLLVAALVATVATIVASIAQTPKASRLVKIGGIAAENGEFAFLNDLITAYSGGNIRFVQGAGEKWNYVQIAGKSASFEVKNLSMRSVSDNVPIGIAHEFSFCDSFDQVSRPVDSAFRAVLPKGAKVKAEEDYGDGQTLVIYTVPVADHYLIDFTLIESTAGKGYSVVGTVPVSEYGDYCGMQAVTREIRAVMVDEPAGSSDYSAVYLFAVRTRKAPEK